MQNMTAQVTICNMLKFGGHLCNHPLVYEEDHMIEKERAYLQLININLDELNIRVLFSKLIECRLNVLARPTPRSCEVDDDLSTKRNH